jgi:hypothetical protein
VLASRFVALALTVAAAPLSAQKQVPGWMYTMNMTTDSGGATHTSNIAMRYAVTDSKLRQEFLQIAGMGETGGAEGMYMIMSVGDSTMTMVMPNQRMASIIAMPMSGAMNMANIKFTPHLNTKVEDMGDGGRLFGHATHHYRVTTSGTIDRTLASGRVCSMRSDGVNEMWIAPDLDIMPAAKMMLKQFGMTDLDSLARQAGSSAIPKGVPLRMIMRHGNVTSTMEYRDIAHTTFDPSYFEVPAGFQTMDMRKMAAMVPKEMMDSIQKSVEDKGSVGCVGSTPD